MQTKTARSSKRRLRELRLAVLSTLFYGVTITLLLPGRWPLMPFPAIAPVEIAGLLGILFGFLTRRAWVMALPFTALVALNPPESGIAGAIIASLVLWPFGAAGGAIGMAAGRHLRRRALRKSIRAARRPAPVRPPVAADTPIRAARAESVPAANAGR
jgi:hypothetical protein